jgi:type I restriction enzyme S subunit
MGINNFKDTHLGPIPVDWEMVRIGDIFEPIHIKLKDYRGNRDDIPILSMTRYQGLILQSDKFDKRVASRDTSNYKIVKYGQLVYGFPMDEGVIAILHRYPMGAVSPAYHVWQPTREIDLTFIDRLLKTPALLRVYKMLSSNVVERRRNLSKRDFVNIEIPLPPLPEQRAIAHVLSNVREAIEATQRVIAAARELKRSLTKHLFTYGSVPVDGIEKVSLKETEIGDMPMHWQEAKLGDVAAKQKYSFVDGPFGSNLKSVHYRDNGILVIQSRYFTQGGFTVTSPVFVSEAKADELIRSNVKAGDIVIAKIGANYGACTIVPTYVERAVLSGNTMKMTVNEDAADKRYVYYFLDFSTVQMKKDQS